MGLNVFVSAIAVGRPVTRPPPHRSRRAVFSHRALQEDSLPQVGLGLEGCLSRLGSSNDPWSGNLKALQYCGVALPGITVALATPIEPLHQDTYGSVKELLQTGSIPVHSIVIGVPTELAMQPLKQRAEPQMPVLFTPRRETLQGVP